MFKRKREIPPPSPLTKFSAIDGLMITDGENHWLISGGKRRKCFSRRVFDSWGLTPILLTKQAINGITPGGTLGFRDGTLIKDIINGRIYLVSRSKARLITSPDVLDALGRDRVIEVSHAEVEIHIEGDPLNAI